MFDAQITVALFAAFLLGMVAGSGIEIIVGGGGIRPSLPRRGQTSKGTEVGLRKDTGGSRRGQAGEAEPRLMSARACPPTDHTLFRGSYVSTSDIDHGWRLTQRGS
jgi:hypothetical protein